MTSREFGTMTACGFAISAVFWFGVFALTSLSLFMFFGVICVLVAILGLSIMAKACPNRTE